MKNLKKQKSSYHKTKFVGLSACSWDGRRLGDKYLRKSGDRWGQAVPGQGQDVADRGMGALTGQGYSCAFKSGRRLSRPPWDEI
uniref:Uncharacterized protein n=1 Tax=Arundo donax TaxID=35708 RepID=A0A0A9CS25_ARUDO